MRDLAQTTLATPDADGVVRPHPELSRVTEAPRRLGDLRELVLRARPGADLVGP